MKRLALFVIGLPLFLAPVAPALAGDDAAWTACESEDDNPGAIVGCTKVIQRGSKETKGDLAIAYTNRGLSYAATGEPLKAIADYT